MFTMHTFKRTGKNKSIEEYIEKTQQENSELLVSICETSEEIEAEHRNNLRGFSTKTFLETILEIQEMFPHTEKEENIYTSWNTAMYKIPKPQVSKQFIWISTNPQYYNRSFKLADTEE